jgi:hypothetical protein
MRQLPSGAKQLNGHAKTAGRNDASHLQSSTSQQLTVNTVSRVFDSTVEALAQILHIFFILAFAILAAPLNFWALGLMTVRFHFHDCALLSGL